MSEVLTAPKSITIECRAGSGVTSGLLSVVVLCDHPFDPKPLGEALFSLAVQDYKHLDVILVCPVLGYKLRSVAEVTLGAQPWPSGTRLRLVEVEAFSNPTASGHLLNAGIRHATGRYIAFLHHHDLVYQHSYLKLIERLRMAPIAFGGVRIATHTYGYRHWTVISKVLLRSLDDLLFDSENRRPTIQAFVADRERLLSDYVKVKLPEASSALAKFLSCLATHSKVDLHFIERPFFETRIVRDTSILTNVGTALVKHQTQLLSTTPVSISASARWDTKLNCKSLPIFINARDLYKPLHRLIRWLLEAGYTNINVLDNDSTYPELLEFYDAIRRDVRIIRLGFNAGQKAIWTTNVLEQLGIGGPYVWTDPDVVPSEECPSNVLEYFYAVLRAYPQKTKVGFGLRIDDLPTHYQFKQRVITWESQFWAKRIAPNLYDAAIDTTFALYRPGSSYDLRAIRTGFPYVARHLPWYENSQRVSKDQAYYVQHARAGINSWNDEKLPDWLVRATNRQ